MEPDPFDAGKRSDEVTAAPEEAAGQVSALDVGQVYRQASEHQAADNAPAYDVQSGLDQLVTWMAQDPARGVEAEKPGVRRNAPPLRVAVGAENAAISVAAHVSVLDSRRPGHEAAQELTGSRRWPRGSLVALLTEGERTALLAAGTPVWFHDDDILVLQGDVGDSLYVLTGGMVKVTVAADTGIETTLAVRSRGDLIGEFAVLDGMPRTATARAVGSVGAVRISRAGFAAYGRQYPATLTTITRSVVAKMRAATERHAAERTRGARERLAQVIYELAESYGERAADGVVVIPLPLTQMELGELAGVAVSTTERVLSGLRKEGIIETGYREMAVRNMDLLGAMRFS
jgi:CRP-like cAMP-binding protein